MSNGMRTVKTLCLCLLASLGAMAAFATAAQAKGDWRVESVTTTAVAKFVGSSSLLTLKSTVGTLAVKIDCTKLEVNDGLISPGGGSLAEFLLSECTTYLAGSGVPSNGCKPQEPMVILAKGLLILHNNETYDLFTPDVGNSFGTVRLGKAQKEEKEEKELTEEEKELALEEECPLVVKFPLTGSFVLGCTTQACGVELVTHSMEQPIASLFPNDTLLFGGQNARLEGAANWKLAAPNENKKWSFVGLP